MSSSSESRKAAGAPAVATVRLASLRADLASGGARASRPRATGVVPGTSMAAGAALEHVAHSERDDVNPDAALLDPGGRTPQQSDPSKGAPKDTPPGASRAKLPPLVQTTSPPRFELPSSVLETHDWQSARDGISSIDIDQIWADAACALDECARADGSPPRQRDAANPFLDDHEGRTPPTALIGYLPCGDVHICRPGIVCEYCQPNKDQLMVCTVTGMIQCPESKDEFFDLNGGDSKRSGDPDLVRSGTRRAPAAPAAPVAPVAPVARPVALSALSAPVARPVLSPRRARRTAETSWSGRSPAAGTPCWRVVWPTSTQRSAPRWRKRPTATRSTNRKRR